MGKHKCLGVGVGGWLWSELQTKGTSTDEANCICALGREGLLTSFFISAGQLGVALDRNEGK